MRSPGIAQPHHLVLLAAAAALAALASLASLSGCGGAPPAQTGDEKFSEIPMNSAAPDTDSKPKPPSSDSGGLSEDQKAQMEVALRRGGEKAANCAVVVPDAPRGEGEVKVLFDGVKGRCVDVTVGPPFAGTPAESCIKRSFVGEIVVPFDGELEVPYTVKLPPKGGEDAKDKGKDAKGKDGKDAKDAKDKGKKK